MKSLVLCRAPEDEAFARELGHFLERNLTYQVAWSEGVIAPGFDLMEVSERALSADAALVLLSPHSVPGAWKRDVWEPLYFEKPGELGSHLGFILLEACGYPALIRRRLPFFDATSDATAVLRHVKRWLLRPDGGTPWAFVPSPVLNELRLQIVDSPGVAAGVEVAIVERFTAECFADFEAVHRIDARARTRAGIVGDVGHATGLRLPGTLAQNVLDLREWCGDHRVLFIFDELEPGLADFVAFGGKASVIIAGTAVARAERAPEEIYAAFLAPLRDRNACLAIIGDAVRNVQALFATDVTAALRLGWAVVSTLQSAERFAEVLELLDAMAGPARDSGDAKALLRVEREQFWMQDYADGVISAPPHEASDPVQLAFGFALH